MTNSHQTHLRGIMQRWFIVSVLFLIFSCPTRAQIFTDWTSADSINPIVYGTLGSTTVTFSWTTGGNVTTTWLDGSYTGFSIAAFTPAITSTDALEFIGNTSGATYTISFGAPTLNPILQFASEGSLLTFGGATPTFISGDGRLSVSGNQVIGTDSNAFSPPNNDANGTIQFLGTYSSLSFTAFWNPGPDGIDLQIGATAVPEPSTSAALAGLGALALAAYPSRRECIRRLTRTHAYARGAANLLLMLGFVLLAGMPARLAGQTVFNPATDFSVSANPGPGGVWSYGYAGTPGQFTLFPLATIFGTGVPAWRNTNVWPTDYPVVFYNASGAPYVYSSTLTLPTGQFGLHPGDTALAQTYAVARLTLPVGGTFLLNAAFVGLESSNGGTTTDAHIFINGALVFDGTVWGVNQLATLIDYTFGASAGSTVDFLVGNGGNGFNSDTTGLNATVVAVPEPSTYASLVGLTALGFAGYRRRRRQAG